jgi:hypothetical protein
MISPEPEFPAYVVTQRHPERAIRLSIRIISMLAELHKAGFQRLRGMPYMSPSGMHWRLDIGPATIFFKHNGAIIGDIGARQSMHNGLAGGSAELIASFSSGAAESGTFFGWSDAAHDSARDLAAKFVKRFPHIAELGTGRDYQYVGWFQHLFGLAEKGWMPIAFSDGENPAHPGMGLIGCRASTWNADSTVAPTLPWPPPGELRHDDHLPDTRA